MMVTPDIPGVSDVINEINLSPDRSSGVVGGSLIDEILKRKIGNFLRPDTKCHEKVFDGVGPLSTFSARIDMGYLLRMYGKEVQRDLHRIRQIRNEFAHQLTATFSTQRIRDLSLALYLPERYTADLELAKEPMKKEKMPDNLMEWWRWIYVPDREQSLKDPRERFIIALQTLAWALSGRNTRLKGGDLG